MAPRLKNENTLPVSCRQRILLSIAEQNTVLLRKRFHQVGKLLQTEIRKQGICRGADGRSVETAGLCSLVCEITHVILFSKLMPI